MVKRCGFYTDGANVICKECAIEWNMGFDKAAKHNYIMQIKAELPRELNPMIDVTSASDSIAGKALSPIFIECGSTGMSIEDYLKKHPECAKPGFFDFIYINCLSDDQKNTIFTTYCFIDVFHKPEKGRNTQASACAYYKLLQWQEKEFLLTDLDLFLDWYNSVPFFRI